MKTSLPGYDGRFFLHAKNLGLDDFTVITWAYNRGGGGEWQNKSVTVARRRNFPLKTHTKDNFVRERLFVKGRQTEDF